MKKIFSGFIISSLLAMSNSSFADTLKPLTKTQVKNAFINKTITSVPIDILNGQAIANNFIAFLDDKGNIYGKLAQKPEHAMQTDKGAYTINNDGSVCITWQHWDDEKKFCFNVYDTKNAYLSIDQNNVFHTAFLKDLIQPGNQITAA